MSDEDEEKSRGSNEERKKEIQDIELREYHSDLSTNKKGKKTPVTYRETFIKLEEWMDEEGVDSWRDLKPAHLSFFNEHLQEDVGLWGRTIDQHMNRLSTFFGDKDRDDLVEKIRGFEKTDQNLYQKETGQEVLYLDIYEYAEILDACETTREELITRILWETGMRRSELAETTIENKIDREKQVFYVDNKKNDETRTIPYSAELKPVLREWLDYGGRSQYSKAAESDYLIITQHSEQVQPAYINKIVRRVADRTDVSYSYAEDAKDRKQWFPTAHHFRHSYATYRVANGMDLKTLSKLMGHKGGVEQTAKYVGILEDGLREDNEKYRPKTRSAAQDVAENI